ncbi:MAG: hypothetical protein IJ299_03745 [Oscillospiraceae bacterium]|nr:hypothetical protein [Oscillospiraceae bacterium]
MRIGVICADEETPHGGFKITKTTENGAVEIYKAHGFKNVGKRRFAREIRRCTKSFSELGVSVCVAEKAISRFCTRSISVISCGERVIRAQAGNAALLFASANGICAEMLVRGGTFSEALAAAKQILKERRNVFVQNSAFDDIAETIYADTGVSIASCAEGSFLEVNLGGEGHFLEFKEKFADFSDISVTVPKIFSEGIPEKLIPQLAETLEISGFLREKEIKIRYLPK